MSDDKVRHAVKSVRDFVNGHIATHLLARAVRATPPASSGDIPGEFWVDLGIILAAAESTLLAPMMPPKPTPEVIEAMIQMYTTQPLSPHERMQRFYEAIYRHLTKARTATLAAMGPAEIPLMPRPDSLDDKALFAMWDAQDANCITKCGAMRAAYKALYEHLTKPKTKTVEVWHVESFNIQAQLPNCMAYLFKKNADEIADALKNDQRVRCVRVTGPHSREISA